MGLHINDIQALYNKGEYTYHDNADSKLEDFRRLPADYIFDDELSVRRNRELVAEHNKKIDDYHKNKREKQAELDKELTNDVVAYIEEYYDLTEAQARIVEAFTYREKHAFMYDYFHSIDLFADFANDLIHWADR